MSSSSQSLELFFNRLGERSRRHLKRDTTEVFSVGVRHLCSDGHTESGSLGANRAHRGAVTGVSAARHVGTRHQPQQSRLGALVPGQRRLTEVAIHVDSTP